MTARAPLTSHMHIAQVYSITERGLGQDPSCCFVLTEECVQILLGHSICYGSEISASQSFGCGAGDYKCSLRIAACEGSANQLHQDGDRFLCTPVDFAGKNKLSLGSKFV